MHAPSGQTPEQEAVDRAECQLAGVGAFADTRHIFEYPADLGRREIRIEAQARFPGHDRFEAVILQRLAE